MVLVLFELEDEPPELKAERSLERKVYNDVFTTGEGVVPVSI